VPELKPWQELDPGGVLVREEAERPRTGGWRTGLKPSADLSQCVNCLLCWLYCPDAAIVLDGTAFVGFDLDVCKGCEICEAVCPVGAVQMVPEATELDPLGVRRG
jgi:2-oxoacid:acceptor oxidoreductase delta subunit (pyruvate/2-ketoisovalerate family)